jgi:hypothetical protein
MKQSIGGSMLARLTGLCVASATRPDPRKLQASQGIDREGRVQEACPWTGEEITYTRGIGTLPGLANTIVNNHFDFDAFRSLTFNLTAARSAVADPYFLSVGHVHEITYANNIGVLADTVDPDFRVLQHPKEWEEPFDALGQRKEEGFYHGSPIRLWPLGYVTK